GHGRREGWRDGGADLPGGRAPGPRPRPPARARAAVATADGRLRDAGAPAAHQTAVRIPPLRPAPAQRAGARRVAGGGARERGPRPGGAGWHVAEPYSLGGDADPRPGRGAAVPR